MPVAYVNSVWTFYLDPRLDGTTRLLTRQLIDYMPENFLNKLIWRAITDPLGFVMMRKMLLTMKYLAESKARQSVGAVAA